MELDPKSSLGKMMDGDSQGPQVDFIKNNHVKAKNKDEIRSSTKHIAATIHGVEACGPTRALKTAGGNKLRGGGNTFNDGTQFGDAPY